MKTTPTRRNRFKALLIGLLTLGPLASAPAQVIYRTGFEKPNFVAGSPLAGQDGWVAGAGPVPFFLSDNAAVVSTAQPRIGRQAVRVQGKDLVHQDILNDVTGGYYDAIGSYRHPVDFDTEGKKLVTVSAWVRVDGRKTHHNENFFSAGLAARGTLANGDTAGVGELDISSDGRVYGHSGNENVPTFQTSARVELGKWHRLAIVIDFKARTYSFFVDYWFLGRFAFDTNNFDDDGVQIDYTNSLKRGSLVAYAAPDEGTLSKADYSASFDQFAITARPRSFWDDCGDEEE